MTKNFLSEEFQTKIKNPYCIECLSKDVEVVQTESKIDKSDEIRQKKERRTEYVILGLLFFAALMAFPAFRDVQLLQSFVISICSGLGLT